MALQSTEQSLENRKWSDEKIKTIQYQFVISCDPGVCEWMLTIILFCWLSLIIFFFVLFKNVEAEKLQASHIFNTDTLFICLFNIFQFLEIKVMTGEQPATDDGRVQQV